MGQEFKRLLGRTYLPVEADARHRWIEVNWLGYLTSEKVKTGATYTVALAK